MASPQEPGFLTPRTPERGSFPLLPAAVAGVIVLLLGAFLFLHSRGKQTDTNALQPLDSHAATLPITGIEMSESTSLSGGKSTYIDGHIRNTGSGTLIAATVQVLFANDGGQPPQISTLPLTLIRTHEPYVDIQPVSAAPIAPGEEREFRLIFEQVDPSWNQAVPEIHIIHTTYR